jgi:AraC-like DNA-binding protein
MTDIRAEDLRLSGYHGRVRCEPTWRLDAAWSAQLRDFDLWLVWAGRGHMRLSDREIPLRPGVCLWMRPGRTYLATQDPEDRLGVSFMHFHLTRPAEFTPPFEVTTVHSLELATALMAATVRLRESAPALARALFIDLLRLLAHDHARQPARPGGAADPRVARLQALAARIGEEPGRDWLVAALAREVGYAPDHFSRRFAALTGLRPQAYVIRARMVRARQLLGESSLSVGEIARVLGFNDVFFFSRQFRQHCGVAPTTFRRRQNDA